MTSMIRMVLGRTIPVECISSSTSIIRMKQTIECEPGFLAQTKIKTPRNSKLLVTRVELLMRLFLLHRKQCGDLMKPVDIIHEAADIFSTMPLQVASNKHWNERSRYFVRGCDNSVV